jgi:hypothetical protein
MPRRCHSSRFYHPYNIRWGVQIMKLVIMKFSPLPCYLVPLRPKYSPQHPISNTLNVSDQVSHPYKQQENAFLITFLLNYFLCWYRYMPLFY